MMADESRVPPLRLKITTTTHEPTDDEYDEDQPSPEVGMPIDEDDIIRVAPSAASSTSTEASPSSATSKTTKDEPSAVEMASDDKSRKRSTDSDSSSSAEKRSRKESVPHHIRVQQQAVLQQKVLDIFSGLLESTEEGDMDKIADLMTSLQNMKERRQREIAGEVSATANGSKEDSPPQLKKEEEEIIVVDDPSTSPIAAPPVLCSVVPSSSSGALAPTVLLTSSSSAPPGDETKKSPPSLPQPSLTPTFRFPSLNALGMTAGNLLQPGHSIGTTPDGQHFIVTPQLLSGLNGEQQLMMLNHAATAAVQQSSPKTSVGVPPSVVAAAAVGVKQSPPSSQQQQRAYQQVQEFVQQVQQQTATSAAATTPTPAAAAVTPVTHIQHVQVLNGVPQLVSTPLPHGYAPRLLAASQGMAPPSGAQQLTAAQQQAQQETLDNLKRQQAQQLSQQQQAQAAAVHARNQAMQQKNQAQLQQMQQQAQQQQAQQQLLQQHREAIQRMQLANGNAAAAAVPTAAQPPQGIPSFVDTSNTSHLYVNHNGQLMRVTNPFFNNGAATTMNKEATPIQAPAIQHPQTQQSVQQRMPVTMTAAQQAAQTVRPAAVLQPMPQTSISVGQPAVNLTQAQYQALLSGKVMPHPQQLFLQQQQQLRPPTSAANGEAPQPALVPLMATSQAAQSLAAPTTAAIPAAPPAGANAGMGQDQLRQLQAQVQHMQQMQLLQQLAGGQQVGQPQILLQQQAINPNGSTANMIRPQQISVADYNQLVQPRFFTNPSS